MPRPIATLPAAALAAALACDQGPCPLPPHCLRAERTLGSCQCAEWETLKVEEFALPYFVAAVTYPMAGNRSSVQYGGTWNDPFDAAATSLTPLGSRWRALVRTGDGSETLALSRPVGRQRGYWHLSGVTPSSLALTPPPDAAIALSFALDVPTHADDDALAVWVNPRASITTDFAGGRTIEWSWSDSFPECGPDTIRVVWLTPAQLEGAAPALGACGQAFLASLDDRQRAEIVSYDAFYSPAGREPQTFWADRRLSPIAMVTVSPFHTLYGPTSWNCLAPLSDETSPGLARSEQPLASGETLVVEHTFLATDAACAPRSLGLVMGTDTDGCQVDTALMLDVAFGTALMVAGTQWDWSGFPACTR